MVVTEGFLLQDYTYVCSHMRMHTSAYGSDNLAYLVHTRHARREKKKLGTQRAQDEAHKAAAPFNRRQIQRKDQVKKINNNLLCWSVF